MKTIEEKAKAYDEALSRAKEVYYRGYYVMGDLETIFPELTESNDEKIKKVLIDIFNVGAHNGGQTNGISDKDILAWLEKQGERHTADI